MPVQCLFHTPKGAQRCQVLSSLGVNTIQPSTLQQLERRFCKSGCFISCPLFNRVEERLAEAHRLRRTIHRHNAATATHPGLDEEFRVA